MLNKMTLQGRLVHSPEIKTTQSGVTLCNFTVANSEKRGENESKLFLSCTAWRGTAELLGKYFSKGQEIIVEGAIYQREYTDRDGNKRTVIEMPSVDRVHFCGPKRDGANNSSRNQDVPPPPDDAGLFGDESDFEPLTDDQMPF